MCTQKTGIACTCPGTRGPQSYDGPQLHDTFPGTCHRGPQHHQSTFSMAWMLCTLYAWALPSRRRRLRTDRSARKSPSIISKKTRFVPDAVQQIRELTVILHEGALKEHELRPAIRELPLQLLELHLKPVQVTLIWVGWERHAYRPREARMETRSAYGRAKTGTQS